MLDGRRFLIKDTFNDTSFQDPARNISIMFFARWFPDEYLEKLLHKWQTANQNIPQYIFFESGAWSLFRYGESSLDLFVRNLSATAQHMAELRHRTTVIWMKTLPFHPTASSHQGHWVTDGNSSTLDKFGKEFEKVAVANQMVLWTSAFDDAKHNLDRYADHVHPGAALIRKSVCQLLQALRCDSCKRPSGIS
ncbi:hypothetical protein RvY_10557-2 [Ramazzottius varieornatus]|uniref:Uncharacterized protein n=1 Tax=Ramazzottius varieornatus TaxID=947166 RepID=A0A1D1VM60_RAMVA|nr:hypothetical protein RvY_10557-2 [Ramazzottius varieornatus]